jgi:hypothetical protein
VFPELTSRAQLHGTWFSRLMDGRLRLSELDAVLLGGLDGSWRATRDVHQALPLGRLARLVWPFHPFFSIYRLRA